MNILAVIARLLENENPADADGIRYEEVAVSKSSWFAETVSQAQATSVLLAQFILGLKCLY